MATSSEIRAIRARLFNPPNAVPDSGIDLRGKNVVAALALVKRRELEERALLRLDEVRYPRQYSRKQHVPPQAVSKAARSGDRARIEKFIAWSETKVRRVFRRFLDEMRSVAVRRQVWIVLEKDGIEAALRLVDAHIARMGTVLAQVFQFAGTAEVAALGRKLRGAHARVAISFDPTHPRAAELMRANRLEFVREMTRAQREATTTALVEALRTGAGPIQVARALRDSIGLTETQRRAVSNYRNLLMAGDAEALNRDLRDRRFDPSVRRAVEDGEPLGVKKIYRMVEQYRNRYLQYRAETIARTEVLRTVGRARRESMTQVLEQIEEPRASVVRTWIATSDKRTRDTHMEMDGQQRGLDVPYESSSGARMMFPGDSSLGAPAAELINCRCVELYEIVKAQPVKKAGFDPNGVLGAERRAGR